MRRLSRPALLRENSIFNASDIVLVMSMLGIIRKLRSSCMPIHRGAGEAEAFGLRAAAADMSPKQLREHLTFPQSWGPTEWGPISFLPEHDILVSLLTCQSSSDLEIDFNGVPTASFALHTQLGMQTYFFVRSILFIGDVPEACPAVTQVQNMERQWGDLDKYRGISTSSKGDPLLPGAPIALWILPKACLNLAWVTPEILLVFSMRALGFLSDALRRQLCGGWRTAGQCLDRCAASAGAGRGPHAAAV